jgi:hypothetical protein
MKLLRSARVRQQMIERNRPELPLSREVFVDQSEARPWPADRVERWPLDRLVRYARNARTHSEEQVAQIAASMREWGWTNPVLVDEAGMIIAGHGHVIELDPKYAEVIIQCCQKATGGRAKHAATGQPFGAVVPADS